nr:serine hydrolase [Archangium violaceum]
MCDTGITVLGVLLSRASGQPLEDFFRERLFEPLGMKDTGFSVPAGKLDRLPTCYHRNPATGQFEVFDAAGQDSRFSRPPGFPSAAGGLVSTADDSLAFARMMLNKGEHGGRRLLSERSVELMNADRRRPVRHGFESRCRDYSMLPDELAAEDLGGRARIRGAPGAKHAQAPRRRELRVTGTDDLHPAGNPGRLRA